MKKGDIVKCVDSHGYYFTEGKSYEVQESSPRSEDDGFSWPAYIRVEDDIGRSVTCHASRFAVIRSKPRMRFKDGGWYVLNENGWPCVWHMFPEEAWRRYTEDYAVSVECSE